MVEGQEGVSWEEWLSLARVAEDAGIEALFRSDHYRSIFRNPPAEAHDAWTSIAAAAAVTSGIRFGTMVSPVGYRHPALLARVCATADRISGGRVELGIGGGWYEREHREHGFIFEDGPTRFSRLEEQVALMRRLWTEESVTYDGEFDRITGAGIAPLPVQRPIPVWFGAQSERAYRRAGRLADGWFPQVSPGPELDQAKEVVDAAAREAGRDPAQLGMEGRVSWRGDAGKLAEQAGRWREAGATHLAVNTMGAGLASLGDHLGVLEVAAEALGVRSS